MITPDRKYFVYTYDWYDYHINGSNPWKLMTQGESEYINGGSEPNTLKVQFNSGHIWIYVNGHELYHRWFLFELGYSMGLFAESYEPGLDVRFDYFGVYGSKCNDLVGGIVDDAPLVPPIQESGEGRSWDILR